MCVDKFREYLVCPSKLYLIEPYTWGKITWQSDICVISIKNPRTLIYIYSIQKRYHQKLLFIVTWHLTKFSWCRVSCLWLLYECTMFVVDTAVYWAHAAIMNNHGQNCCAGSRTLVQESIYDDFVEKSRQMAENRTVGDPYDGATQQGPQVTRQSSLYVNMWS